MSEDKQTQLVAGKRTKNWAAFVSPLVGFVIVVLVMVLNFVHPKVIYALMIGGVIFTVMCSIWMVFRNKNGLLSAVLGIVLCFIASVIYPAFRLSYVLAGSVECQLQLREVSKGILAYQKMHHGLNPPSLETLVDEGFITGDILICPRCKDPSVKQSYIYRGGDLTDKAQGEMIIVYDEPRNHKDYILSSDFIMVLFAGDYVKKVCPEEFGELFDRDNALRREMGIAEKAMEVRPWVDREGKEIKHQIDN